MGRRRRRLLQRFPFSFIPGPPGGVRLLPPNLMLPGHLRQQKQCLLACLVAAEDADWRRRETKTMERKRAEEL